MSENCSSPYTILQNPVLRFCGYSLSPSDRRSVSAVSVYATASLCLRDRRSVSPRPTICVGATDVPYATVGQCLRDCQSVSPRPSVSVYATVGQCLRDLMFAPSAQFRLTLSAMDAFYSLCSTSAQPSFCPSRRPPKRAENGESPQKPRCIYTVCRLFPDFHVFSGTFASVYRHICQCLQAR